LIILGEISQIKVSKQFLKIWKQLNKLNSYYMCRVGQEEYLPQQKAMQ